MKGFKMFGWIKSALSVGVSVVKFLTGVQKPKLTDVIPFVLEKIFPAVERAIAYGSLDTKEKIDTWLEEFDAKTGIEPTAVDIIPDMPPEVEEEFWDKIKEAVQIFAYCKARVPGYFV